MDSERLPAFNFLTALTTDKQTVTIAVLRYACCPTDIWNLFPRNYLNPFEATPPITQGMLNPPLVDWHKVRIDTSFPLI